MNKIYNLWIGGILELEDVTLEEAESGLEEWYYKGYDDAVITDNKGKIINQSINLI